MDLSLWSRDMETHSCGFYSYAAVQANAVLNHRSQVETGSNAIFIGLYEGHGGGPDAAEFLVQHLFENVINDAHQEKFLCEHSLKAGIAEIEDRFIAHVRGTKQQNPNVVTAGSSCLVGFIYGRKVFLGNIGDSRAVVGTIHRENLIAEQMSEIHNVNEKDVRKKYIEGHGEASVTSTDGTYTVKGIIQVVRSIGDAYLKHVGCQVPQNVENLEKYRIPDPLQIPYLTSDPQIKSFVWGEQDKFIIFASASVWEHIDNAAAVKIVSRCPSGRGAARRLITAAMEEAAKGLGVTYKGLLRLTRTERRNFHDDMTAVVVFVNSALLGRKLDTQPISSVKAFQDYPRESSFFRLDHLM